MFKIFENSIKSQQHLLKSFTIARHTQKYNYCFFIWLPAAGPTDNEYQTWAEKVYRVDRGGLGVRA